MGWVRSNKKGSGGGARYGLYPIKEIDLIPEAQVDNTNIIYSGYDFSGYPYQAFDKTGASWVSNQTTTYRARYIGFKFTEPTLCNCVSIEYGNGSSYWSSQRPAQYTVQGSNDDGTTWTDIFTDYWNPPYSSSGAIRKITFENFDEYKWYRIAVDYSGGDGYCIITEVTFYKVVYGQIEVESVGPTPIANFTTSLALPLVALKAYITAQGGGGTPSSPVAITGFDSVKITRAGKNLINNTDFFDYSNWKTDIASNPSYPTNTTNRGYQINLPVGTYTLSFGFDSSDFPVYIYLCKDNGTETTREIIFTSNNYTANKGTFTIDGTSVYYIRMTCGDINAFNTQIAKISFLQLESGSTATAYEPYETSTIYTIQLGQTCYGGYVDWKNGKGYITSQMFEFDGSNDEVWDKYTVNTDQTMWRTSIPERKSGELAQTGDISSICNRFERATNNTTGRIQGKYSGALTYFDVIYNDASDLTAWRTWLANNPIQLVVELATPISTDITIPDITALVGENNIFADTGNIEVSFKQGICDYDD